MKNATNETIDRVGLKQGLFWVATPRGVQCLICPNECSIREGESGLCQNRINKGDKLYSIAYGNPCTVNIDPIEKKPLYHFLPGSRAFSIGSAGCNLACLNCQNWTISQTSPQETRNIPLMPNQVIEQTIENRCTTIAYTYTEPICSYEYTLDTAMIAHENKLKNILVTSGYVNEEPLRKLCSFIDAANVDLKSFSDHTYHKLSAGALQPILTTLKIMAELGVWLEITNLIIPGWTENRDQIKKMCGWLASNGFSEYPLHLNRFYPEFKLMDLSATPLDSLLSAREIALAQGIKYVYIGNAPSLDSQNTNCPKCHELLIERNGFSILQQNLAKSRCTKCGETISGVWE